MFSPLIVSCTNIVPPVTDFNETEIPILWRSDHAMAVGKPAGVSTQAANEIDSLEQRLRNQLSRSTEYLAFPHRLDRPVSGVILVATSKRAANLLREQFEFRKVQKTYLALVQGEYSLQRNAVGDPETWSDYLCKQPDKAMAMVVDERTPGAKKCVTRVNVVRYDSSHGCTILRLHPKTGRMHQLRVQAAYRRHPILGDLQYGWKQENDRTGNSFSPQRIGLHAETISFFDPKNGRHVSVTAPADASWPI